MAKLDYRTGGYFERTQETKESNLVIPRWLLPLVGAVAVLGFIFWFFTEAPWLKVKDIRIEGQVTDESKTEIERLRGQNILWLSVTRPDQAIRQKQPSIKQIQILRGIPDTLRVKLIEREPAMIWQVGETWYTVDPSGFVFKEQGIGKKPDGSLDYPGTDLPVVVDAAALPTQIGKYVVRPQFILFVHDLKDRLPKEFSLKFIRAEVAETPFNVTVVTDAGWNILFDTTRLLDPQLHMLTKVLEGKRADIHEYIDVRVRGWVYYK